MKKIIIGVLLAGVLLIGAGVFLVFNNLDSIVKQVIETAGTEAMGTKVTVDSVDLRLAEGTASIYGFAIANPQGFSSGAMLSFAELSVALDLVNLSQQHIGILSVVARNPQVLFESRDNTSNLAVMNQRLGGSSKQASSQETATPIQLTINSLQIDDIGATLTSDLLPEPVIVNLGDIILRNLKGNPDEIAKQITAPLISQLSTNAATALVTASSARLRENARQLSTEALEQADRRRAELEDELKEDLDETLGKDVRESLGNLLDRN